MQATVKIDDGFATGPFGNDVPRDASGAGAKATTSESRGTLFAAALMIVATTAMVSAAIALAPSCNADGAGIQFKVGGMSTAGCAVVAPQE